MVHAQTFVRRSGYDEMWRGGAKPSAVASLDSEIVLQFIMTNPMATP